MLVLLIIIALLQPAASWAQSASLAIDAGSGVKLVEVDRGRGNAVFSLAALEPVGARVVTDSRSAKLLIFNDTLTFHFGSPFFRIKGDVFQLAAPARPRGLVSADLITTWLPARYPAKLTFTNNTLRLKHPATPLATHDPSPPPATRPAPATAPAPGSSNKDRVVVIDAGHGGRDPGKVGANGLSEKVVTLSVATKLASLLRERGFEVHLTRASDTLVALADRPKLANQWKNSRPATLFVSIHANSGVANAAGFETYFLSEARTEDERRVAEMENAAISFEERAGAAAPALEQLLSGLRNDYYQRASNDFAEVIQRELAAFHPGRSRGVKQAGFRVLVGALMPAVLVEIAFISNPAEARLLGTSAFQGKIAFGLSRSIANFFDSHEHLWANTAGQQ